MTLAFLYPKAILLPLMAAVLSKQVAILELVLEEILVLGNRTGIVIVIINGKTYKINY